MSTLRAAPQMLEPTCYIAAVGEKPHIIVWQNISKNVTNYSPTVRTKSSAQPLQCLDFVFHDGIFCKGPTAFRRRHDLVAGADLAPWPTSVTSFKFDERSWH